MKNKYQLLEVVGRRTSDERNKTRQYERVLRLAMSLFNTNAAVPLSIY